jgi:hypothetical protein
VKGATEQLSNNVVQDVPMVAKVVDEGYARLVEVIDEFCVKKTMWASQLEGNVLDYLRDRIFRIEKQLQGETGSVFGFPIKEARAGSKVLCITWKDVEELAMRQNPEEVAAFLVNLGVQIFGTPQKDK